MELRLRIPVGNTENEARAVAADLEVSTSVSRTDSDSAPDSLEGYDLVVVGGPTHPFSATRAATRDGAAKGERCAPRTRSRHPRVGGLFQWSSAVRWVRSSAEDSRSVFESARSWAAARRSPCPG
jgi:hypothetical protein